MHSLTLREAYSPLTELRPVFQKALCPMEVASGELAEVRLLHSQKAATPMISALGKLFELLRFLSYLFIRNFEEKTNRSDEEGAKGRKEVPLHVSLSALFAFAVKKSSLFWQIPAFEM
jgi:hypothetical protein